jgi:ABC-type multidrug transport system ATPase subunit/ABC-type multidrug transport system permease subunit
MCSSDEACSTSTGNSGATCNRDFPFTSSSKVKSYVCNPTAPDLVLGLIAPNSLLIQCHTLAGELFTGGGGSLATAPPTLVEEASAPAPEVVSFSPPATAPVVAGASPPVAVAAAPPTAPAPGPASGGLVVNGTDISGLLNEAGQALGRKRLLLQAVAPPAAEAGAPYCEIGFKVEDPALQVQCRANDCALQVGSSTVTCQQTTCECEGDPTCANNGLIASLATLVNGKAELICTPGAANEPAPCTLKLAGLPINEIEAQCQASECIVPEDNGFNGSNSTTPEVVPPPAVPNLNINPIIAAIPLMFLTVIVGFVGTYTWMHRSMWSASAAAAAAAGAGGAGAASKHGKKVKTLEFKDICVKVPMDVTTSTKKHQALRQKALARHDTMHITTQTTPSGGGTRSSLAGILSRQARYKLGFKGSEEDLQLSPQEERAAMAAAESEDLTSAADFVSQLHGNPEAGTWTVVEDCTGIASAGEVVGVLGPSGCGKTTLLTSIVGSSLELGSTALMTGAVLIDGLPRQGQDVAYVPQADTLIPTLTVAECVRYSALLRLPRNTPIDQVHYRVAGVLEELGLSHVADSPVGGSGNIRGVSGGERRRVTIGMELVTDPAIIVLDEPTSGLDSYTAINLIRSLRTVAAGGRVVIASLHQPSKDMFYALDSVILMGHGRMLFKGRPEEAEAALAMAGVPCPEDTAIAEFMLKVASNPADIKAMLKMKYKSSSAALNTLGGGAANDFKSGGGGVGVGAVVESKIYGGVLPAAASPTADGRAVALSTSLNNADGNMEAASPPEQRTLSLEDSKSFSNVAVEKPHRSAGFARQLAVMFWRTSMDIMRNPTLLMLHVGIAAIVGVLNGAIFYQVEPDFSGVQNRMGATFFALALLAFTSLTTVDLLMNERNVVMREVRSGYYGPVAYLLSKLALDGMLLRAIPAIVFWAPFYYMTGFRSGAAYAATYVFTMVAFNCCIGALSMAVTVGCNTAGQAAFVMNFTLLFMLVFTGFLVKISSVTPVLAWIHFLSPFFYAFEAMLSTELNGQLIDFAYQPTPDVPVTVIPDLKGETFLTSLGLSTTNTTRDLGVLVALYVAFMALALGLFLFKMPRSSNSAAAKAAKKAAKKAGAGAAAPPAAVAGQEKGGHV